MSLPESTLKVQSSYLVSIVNSVLQPFPNPRDTLFLIPFHIDPPNSNRLVA